MTTVSSLVAPSVLTSFYLYDELIFNASKTASPSQPPNDHLHLTRPQGSNLDVLFKGANDHDQDDPPLGLCHLSTIFGYTADAGSPILSRFEESAAVALAAHHLNTGNSSLVPDLEGLPTTCPIRFTVGFENIFADTGSALRTVVEQTDPPREGNSAATETSASQHIPRPCAFVGAYRSAMSIPTSMITGLRNYPQVSGGSTSHDLDDVKSYPLFARTISSDAGNSGPILKFFQSKLDVTHLAVLHVNDAYGNAFAAGLRDAALRTDMTLSTVGFSASPSKEDIREAVESLKISQFRYFFVIAFEVFDELMLEAHRQGIAGKDGTHSWFFSDSFEPDQVMKRKFQRNSVLQQAYNGIGFIGSTAGTEGMESFDNFQEQMKELQNEGDISYLVQRKLPEYDLLHEESFLRPTLSSFAAFYYDASIALGLAACKAVRTSDDSSSPHPILMLDGKEHHQSLVQQEFQGVTGNVVLNKETGSRDATTTFFRVINFVVDEEKGTDETVEFRQMVTNIFQEGTWEDVNDFYFSSGTTETPPDLPPFELNTNSLDTQVEVLVFAMSATAMLLATSFAIWTKLNSHTRVVRASQPIFLYIVCAGALLLASSIIPSSYNHAIGTESSNDIDLACNFVPWLVIMGVSLLFSALFTKTHRVNVIMENPADFRRIKVTAMDVAKPMIGFLLVNALILAVMTALAPLKWQVNVVSVDRLREKPTETYGSCSLGKEQLPYMLILAIVNIGLLFFTSYEAYKARSLSTEFAESQYIFRVLVSILLVCFVGGPVLLLANENPNAYIFVGSAIIFVTSASTLLWIFVPKILFARDPKAKRRKTSTRANFSESGVEFGSTDRHWSSTFGGSVETGDGGWGGERIITAATQKELAIENEWLRSEGERLRCEVVALKRAAELIEPPSPSERKRGYVQSSPANTISFDENNLPVVSEITASGYKMKPLVLESHVEGHNEDHQSGCSPQSFHQLSDGSGNAKIAAPLYKDSAIDSILEEDEGARMTDFTKEDASTNHSSAKESKGSSGTKGSKGSSGTKGSNGSVSIQLSSLSIPTGDDFSGLVGETKEDDENDHGPVQKGLYADDSETTEPKALYDDSFNIQEE